jgi:hypothetical protein
MGHFSTPEADAERGNEISINGFPGQGENIKKETIKNDCVFQRTFYSQSGGKNLAG